MDQIYKVVLTLLMTVALVLSGASLVTANVDVVTANNYFDDLATVIQESNYNANVIQDCIDEAEANGYTLTVNVIGSAEPGMKRYAEVEFGYTYSMPVFGVNEPKTKMKII